MAEMNKVFNEENFNDVIEKIESKENKLDEKTKKEIKEKWQKNTQDLKL